MPVLLRCEDAWSLRIYVGLTRLDAQATGAKSVVTNYFFDAPLYCCVFSAFHEAGRNAANMANKMAVLLHLS